MSTKKRPYCFGDHHEGATNSLMKENPCKTCEFEMDCAEAQYGDAEAEANILFGG